MKNLTSMSKKFTKRLNESITFEEWLGKLKRFDFSLIKENELQTWTLKDYQEYWTNNKEF